jgi:hypothetical protein
MMELQIYQRATNVYNTYGYLVPSGSLAVIVQASAHSTVSALRKPSMLVQAIPSSLWIVLIIALATVIALWEINHAPNNVLTKTTTVTTPPTTKDVPSGQMVSVGTGQSAQVTGGSGGDTTITPVGGGTPVVVPQGKTASAGPGSVVNTGSGSAVVTTAGTTTTTQEQQQEENTLETLAKYALIGLGIAGGAALLIAGFQAFGKREIYRLPVSRRR